jgi:molybdopterin synthase catalytic subunit
MVYNLRTSSQRRFSPQEAQVGDRTVLEITDQPITPEKVTSGLDWDDRGAMVTFTGRVRSESEKGRVVSLEHEAPREMAETLLRDLAGEMRRKWDLGTIAFTYRTGPVPAGDITLVIAVISRHRPEAFAACQYAIDHFKQKVSAKEVLEDA